MWRRLWHLFIPLGWILISLLASCRGDGRSRPEHVPYAARVFVVGWDGADWKVIEPLLARGALPHLARLMEEGAHYFWKYRFAEEWNWIFPDEPVTEADVERNGGTIEAYYELQDRRLGEILRHADDETTILLCSDHGFTTGRRGPASSVSGVHWLTASPGVLILSGAGVRRGAALDHAHVFDIAPTVLALLGLPVDPSMDGRVLTEALSR
jgi:predicted AlkP superfamily phosphohydrolase/phosphomutase